MRVAPTGRVDPGPQHYEPSSLISRTTLRTEDAIVEIRDGAPWDGGRPPNRVVRIVTVARGPVDLAVDVVPSGLWRPARDVSTWSEGAAFDGTIVRTGLPMIAKPDGSIAGVAHLDTGDRLVVTLDTEPGQDPLSPDRAAALLDRTRGVWRRTIASAELSGPWADAAAASAIVLRALSTSPLGGLVSAPTTSLPDREGGEGTADGRVVSTVDVATWVDAAAGIGLFDEVARGVAWLEARLDDDPPLPGVVGLDGAPPPSERQVAVRGWRRSEPVRLGVDPPSEPGPVATASVLRAVAAVGHRAVGEPLLGRWPRLVAMTDWLVEHWADVDAGPWDLRVTFRPQAGRDLLVTDALRAMSALARRRNPLDFDAPGWDAARVRVEAALLAAVDLGRGALGADAPDASVLQIAWRGPWPADDPVVAATVDTVGRRLAVGPWLYPYPPERGARAASVLATLWWVRAMAALGRWDEAHLTMEAVATLAGPLGLLPQWVDPVSGAARGNRPYAAAHVAFIEAAAALGDQWR